MCSSHCMRMPVILVALPYAPVYCAMFTCRWALASTPWVAVEACTVISSEIAPGGARLAHPNTDPKPTQTRTKRILPQPKVAARRLDKKGNSMAPSPRRSKVSRSMGIVFAGIRIPATVNVCGSMTRTIDRGALDCELNVAAGVVNLQVAPRTSPMQSRLTVVGKRIQRCQNHCRLSGFTCGDIQLSRVDRHDQRLICNRYSYRSRT